MRRDLWRLNAYVLNHVVARVPLRAPRMWLYERMGVKLKDRRASVILMGTRIWTAARLEVGEDTVVGREGRIDCGGWVTIGDHVNISPSVHLQTGRHRIDDPGGFEAAYAPIVVRDYVWLCERSTVLGGVTIGEGAVVMAGAVVTRDVEPWTIVGGCPARPVGTRPGPATYRLDYLPNFA